MTIGYTEKEVKEILQISHDYRDWLGSTAGYVSSPERPKEILGRMEKYPGIFDTDMNYLKQEIPRLSKARL